MVPEIFLTGPLCVEGAGDPLHGLKTVPVNLIEQCLKCDRLQWTSPLSNPPKNEPNCGDGFKEDSVSSEESTEPLCLPVWLEGFLSLQVTKKPLHEPSRAAQSCFSKQCSENSSLSQSSQTPSTDEERLKSEGSPVSGDAPALPPCLPVGLEGCLYVQDIKKPVHALKTTQAQTRKHCNTLKTSPTTKGAAREENQGGENGIVSKRCCPDELEKSIHSQDIKTPPSPSKTAKTLGKKSDVKIDNLRPISQSLSPVEVRPRCQKVFVSGETSAVQAFLPVELEESIFVQDIKNPWHESKTLQTQLNKQNLKCNDLQPVVNAVATSNSEKQRSRDSVVPGQSCLPVGLERALYIHDIKKPLHALGRARNGFNKLSLKLDSLLKTPESTHLKGEKKRLREAVASGGAPAGRHCVPVKLEETLSVQDIKKPAYQTRSSHSRINKQNLKRDNVHTKSPACKSSNDKQKCRDALVLEVAKTPVRLNESLRVQAIKNPLREAKTSETQARFRKQNLSSSKVPPSARPLLSRKEKLFLEERPEEWYSHNIGLERCLNIQPIKNPLHQSEAAQPCLGKRCLRCDKLLSMSQAALHDKKKLKCKVSAVPGGCGPAGQRHCQENPAAQVRTTKHLSKGSDLHRPLHKAIRKVRK